jgi:hypothetical protein
MIRCSICGESGHDRRNCDEEPLPKRVWCPKDCTPFLSSDGSGKIEYVPNSEFSEPCECGGTTGVCGTPQGARKWRAHIGTARHMKWQESQYK